MTIINECVTRLLKLKHFTSILFFVVQEVQRAYYILTYYFVVVGIVRPIKSVKQFCCLNGVFFLSRSDTINIHPNTNEPTRTIFFVYRVLIRSHIPTMHFYLFYVQRNVTSIKRKNKMETLAVERAKMKTD